MLIINRTFKSITTKMINVIFTYLLSEHYGSIYELTIFSISIICNKKNLCSFVLNYNLIQVEKEIRYKPGPSAFSESSNQTIICIWN